MANLILTVEGIQRGKHLEQLNGMIMEMFEHLKQFPELETPRRKVVATYGMYQNENDQICLQVDLKSSFPGPKHSSRDLVAVGIRKEKNQLCFEFSVDPQAAGDGLKAVK